MLPGKDGHPRYFNRFLKQLGGIRPAILSDSFEALRISASAGVMVSVLPNRVAQRTDDLLEIFPEGKKNREPGRHRLLLVSQANCDIEEVDFLAAEALRLLNKT